MSLKVVVWDEAKQVMKRSDADALDYRSGSVDVDSGTTSVAVAFSRPMPNDQYIVVATWVNTVDANPNQYPNPQIISVTVSGFVMRWASTIQNANYKLHWFASSPA
jgi:hypothetical protein